MDESLYMQRWLIYTSDFFPHEFIIICSQNPRTCRHLQSYMSRVCQTYGWVIHIYTYIHMYMCIYLYIHHICNEMSLHMYMSRMSNIWMSLYICNDDWQSTNSSSSSAVHELVVICSHICLVCPTYGWVFIYVTMTHSYVWLFFIWYIGWMLKTIFFF